MRAFAGLTIGLSSFALTVFALTGAARSQEEVGKRERAKIEIKWSKYEDSNNYLIDYELGISRATVKQIADSLEDVLSQYVLVFKYKPTQKMKVKFLDSPNTYEQEGGKPSTAGHFDPGSECLVVKQLPFYELIPTVYHEAFHQYLHFYVGKGVPIPMWFNEGMAGYYQEIRKNKGTKKLDYKLISNRKLRMVKDKVMTRTAIPLEKLLDATYDEFHDKEDSQKEALHYNQSFGLVYFFMQGMGGKPVFQFADELKKTKDVGAAYEKILGKDRKNLKSLEAKWKSYMLAVKVEEA